MRIFPIALIIFWVIIILSPEILAYLVGWFFIFVWVNILFFFWFKKNNKENYVKFGKYKIYR